MLCAKYLVLNSCSWKLLTRPRNKLQPSASFFCVRNQVDKEQHFSRKYFLTLQWLQVLIDGWNISNWTHRIIDPWPFSRSPSSAKHTSGSTFEGPVRTKSGAFEWMRDIWSTWSSGLVHKPWTLHNIIVHKCYIKPVPCFLDYWKRVCKWLHQRFSEAWVWECGLSTPTE